MQDALPKASAETPHILIVEQDAAVGASRRLAFQAAGMTAVAVGSAVAALQHLEAGGAMLVVADLDLPDASGTVLLELIRKRSAVPVIIVGPRNEKQRRIAALSLGADGYVEKPADNDVLIAHVQAVLRRGQLAAVYATDTAHTMIAAAEPPQAQLDEVVTFEGWTFDIAGQTLETPKKKAIEIAAAESALLAVFARHPRKILSRAEITALGGADVESDERSIDVILGKLRKKLAPHADGAKLIKTVRGKGYLFSARVLPVG